VSCHRSDEAVGTYGQLKANNPAPAKDSADMIEADDPTTEPPKRKRRWFQFSLRTLLIDVTLLATACGYIGWQARIVYEQKSLLARIKIAGGDYREMPTTRPPFRPDLKYEPPLIRRWLGEPTIRAILLPEGYPDRDMNRVAAAFPGAIVGRGLFDRWWFAL
jgi:hypothetical protein